jgi:hypothetical protein
MIRYRNQQRLDESLLLHSLLLTCLYHLTYFNIFLRLGLTLTAINSFLEKYNQNDLPQGVVSLMRIKLLRKERLLTPLR